MCSAKTQVYENFQETYHDSSWHISNHSNHSWAWSKGLFGLAWCPLTVFSSAFWAAHVRFTLDYLILCCAQSNSSLHIAHDGFPRTIQESVKTCTHTHMWSLSTAFATSGLGAQTFAEAKLSPDQFPAIQDVVPVCRATSTFRGSLQQIVATNSITHFQMVQRAVNGMHIMIYHAYFVYL